MRSITSLIAGGLACVAAQTATAADLAIARPPMPAIAVEEFGSWYLRGDIGFSNQMVKNLDIANYRDPGITIPSQRLSFDTAGVFQLGVGYQFNNWFRADLTGQYRGSAPFHGLDLVSFNGAPLGADTYRARKYEWVGMINGYADLGTWSNITPFVGAGVGFSRNTIAGFVDQGVSFSTAFGTSPTTAYANDASKWNFAWALHAGLAYRVTPGLTMELAYSYMNLGDGLTGGLTDFLGRTRNNPFTFKEITSHDVKLGMRWAIDTYLPPPPPPIIRKG